MDNYLGEIRVFPYNKQITGWVPCNGQILPIQQNAALFSLLSNNYGGDGRVNFGLPNLNGTVIVGTGRAATGTNYALGNAGAGGAESVTLTTAQIPGHTHAINVGNTYDGSNPTNRYLGNPSTPTSSTQANKNPAGSTTNLYVTGTPNVAMNSNSIAVTGGGGAAHENRQPFVPLMYYIATVGNYPPRP